jgi:WD40 repeat protein
MRWLTVFALLAAATAAAQDKKDAKDLPPIPTIDLKRTAPVEYAKDVEPIFANKCFVCHSGNVTEAKFDMGTHAGVLKGGKRGAAVVPGKSAESNLFLFCSRQKKPMMPPKTEEPLTSQEVSVIKLWIDEGAKAPTTAREKVKVVVNLPPAIVKPVRAVAVSPDGKTVAASRGNQVHLFDGKKGEYLKTLVDPKLTTPDGKPAKAAHISLVESMAFSPDGKTLATGSFQELTLWDVGEGEPKQHVGGFADRVVAVAYSPDGKYIATGGGAPTEDGEIKILDAETGKVLHEIKNGHSDTVFGVAFSPDGRLLATAAADKFVKVFELPHAGYGWPFGPGPETPRLTKAFEGHTHHVMDVGWTPDGKKLVSCGADNFVKVWSYETGEKVRDMQGHQKQVTRLAFVGKTPQFLTASGDTQVRMWNADNGGNVRQFPGASDFLYAVSVSADGEVVATGGEEGIVRVYNGKNAQLIKAALPPDAEPKK